MEWPVDSMLWLSDRAGEVVEYARQLISEPSTNPPGDEGQVAAWVVERLRALGVAEVRQLSGSEKRPNVVARLPGAGPGPVFMLQGHMDTKPPGDLDTWTREPFGAQIADGRLYGLGAADMKGGLAAMVYALGALAGTAARFPGSVLAVFTADEEMGGDHGCWFLADRHTLRADAAIVCEPSGLRGDLDSICTVSYGFCGVRFRVRGKQAHSGSLAHTPPANAALGAAELLRRLEGSFRPRHVPHPFCPGGPLVNPGAWIRGGDTYGTVCGLVEFGVDVRPIPGMTREGVMEDLAGSLVSTHLPEGVMAEFELERGRVGWNPPVEIDARAPVVRAAVKAAERVLGFQPELRAVSGSTEACAWASLGIPTIPAFGPGLLQRGHSPDEYVSVDSIVAAAQVYVLTLLYFTEEWACSGGA